MSNDSALDLMDLFDKKDRHAVRRDFIARMEHKLHAKERNNRFRR